MQERYLSTTTVVLCVCVMSASSRPQHSSMYVPSSYIYIIVVFVQNVEIHSVFRSLSLCLFLYTFFLFFFFLACVRCCKSSYGIPHSQSNQHTFHITYIQSQCGKSLLLHACHNIYNVIPFARDFCSMKIIEKERARILLHYWKIFVVRTVNNHKSLLDLFVEFYFGCLPFYTKSYRVHNKYLKYLGRIS